MNRFLVVIGLIVVCAIGAGFYLEYLRISSESSDGVTHITLTVDQKRSQPEEKKAVQRVHDSE